MVKHHDFEAMVAWTGNRAEGTRSYRGYDRTWVYQTAGGLEVQCSNDPNLGGDGNKPNPETMLLASLSACHMLWYLHLASDAGVIVHAYEDNVVGTGETGPRGEGRFISAVLRPRISLAAGADVELADRLHHKVKEYCFIARSINFPVRYEASYQVGTIPAQSGRYK